MHENRGTNFWDTLYITAFTSISSTAFETEALSFTVNKFTKKTQEHFKNTNKCDAENLKLEKNPVSYRKPQFCKRRV